MGTLHLLKSATDTIGGAYLYKTGDDLIVIDGGMVSDGDTVFNAIKELGGKVSAWFLSHAHGDHVGAICAIIDKHPNEVEIKAFYYGFPSSEDLMKYESASKSTTENLLPKIERYIKEKGIEHIIPKKGDVYEFCDCKINMLRIADPSITEDFINNSSLVFSLNANGKRVMFLGDLGIEGGRQLLEIVPPEELLSDYVQMAHHGQDGVERDVYEAIKPSYCIWPTPTWLWDNIGPEGYDTGRHLTLIVRGWMRELGTVKKHYIDKDFPIEIEI